MFHEKVILVTGGTGFFGKNFVKTVLEKYRPQKLIVFSRDEFKQFEMSQTFNDNTYPPIRYFLGDIRDKGRLYRAFEGVDIVVHAAALKQVPALEYNPFEAVQTNIVGAQNITNAAIDKGVKKIIALSSDKAVNPVNLYGATKLCMEKLFLAANAYAGAHDTSFSVVRYGNVVGSRGSVVPLFLKQNGNGRFTVTDPEMTRFWITVEQGIDLVMKGLEIMKGGEIFTPRIPSAKVTDICCAINPECQIESIGIRPGEKLHEILISEEEARYTYDMGDYYVICPPPSCKADYVGPEKSVAEEFSYSSKNNDQWLGIRDLRSLIKELKLE